MFKLVEVCKSSGCQASISGFEPCMLSSVRLKVQDFGWHQLSVSGSKVDGQRPTKLRVYYIILLGTQLGPETFKSLRFPYIPIIGT